MPHTWHILCFVMTHSAPLHMCAATAVDVRCRVSARCACGAAATRQPSGVRGGGVAWPRARGGRWGCGWPGDLGDPSAPPASRAAPDAGRCGAARGDAARGEARRTVPRGDGVGRCVGATYAVAVTPAPGRSRGEVVKAVGCSCRRWHSGCAALPLPASSLAERACVAAWRARGEAAWRARGEGGAGGDTAGGGVGGGRVSGASGTSDVGIALARRRCSLRASMSAKRQSRRHMGHVVLLSIHRLVHFSQNRCWHGNSLHASPSRKLVRQTGQSAGRPIVVYLVFCRAAYSAAESPLPDGLSSGGPAPVMFM